MTRSINHNIFWRWLCLVGCCIPLELAAQGDSSKPAERESLIYLKYHVKNNRIPYLQVQTKTKEDKAFMPAGNTPVELYLDKDSASDALIGRLVTDKSGEAVAWLPASAAAAWDQKDAHTFFAHSGASNDFKAVKESLTITMARLELDTATGTEGRSLTARLLKKEADGWVPIAGADMQLVVKRLGGFLPIAADETYTTDSTGSVTGEFLLTDLPGDSTGNIECVARVEDHDEIGTLETSLVIPWGIPVLYNSEFGKRTLWATGTRAPFWLMALAYGCIIGVWSVIIYLLMNLYRIKKLGSRK